MLPIRENVLYLSEIAEYWSRELHGLRTPYEIFPELLSAFWQGHLAVVTVHNLHPIGRQSLLKAINAARKLIPEHPGFTFVDCTQMIPPGVEMHPDGSITIDRGPYVVLPADNGDWTDEINQGAYDQFAKIPIGDFDELLKPGIYGLGATRDALAAFCDEIGYERPRFWFRQSRRDNWTARREREAERWFKGIAKGPKCKTKSAYRAEAAKQLAVPAKAFDRIWEKFAPETWKRSGPAIRSNR
jgi:hypothetical protein